MHLMPGPSYISFQLNSSMALNTRTLTQVNLQVQFCSSSMNLSYIVARDVTTCVLASRLHLRDLSIGEACVLFRFDF